MQRINDILERSKAAKNQATTVITQSPQVSKVKQLSRFINDNKLPRYVLFGVIMLKS